MANPNEWMPAVRRWDPFGDLDVFKPSLFRRLLSESWGDAPAAGSAETALPVIDVGENEKSYVVTAELPGCKLEDISVQLEHGALTIRGEKRSGRSGEKEQLRWTERSFGSFHRSFRLPADASEGGVEASFRDGVLTVEIAKSKPREPTIVRIKT